MLVRFKKKYSAETDKPISYELVSGDERLNVYYEGGLVPCYNTKVLGLVPIHFMEIVTNEDDCVPAIDVLVKISTK